MHPRRLLLLFATIALLAAAACGDDGGSAPDPDASQPEQDAGGEILDPGEDAAAAASGSGSCAELMQMDGDDDCTAPLAPGSDRNCVMDFGGTQRNFLLYAPDNYDPCTPTALVVDAHGAGENAQNHAGLESFMNLPNGVGSGYRIVADREGFVVATPQGLSDLWAESDVAFMHEVVSTVKALAQIDDERVYMTGISLGAGLSYWIGCDSTELFRGVSPIAGLSVPPCAAIQRPTSLIAFHAVGDALVPYASGRSAAEAYAQLNNCSNGPTESHSLGGPDQDGSEICYQSPDGPDWELVTCDPDNPAATCETWDGCDDDVEVVFCTVPAMDILGGHILYNNQTLLSLAAATWQFFEKFQ